MSLSQLLLGALAPGCICGLIACGLALICESTGAVSVAEGELMMLGAFAGLVATTVPAHDFGAEEKSREVPGRHGDALAQLPADDPRDRLFHRKDLRHAARSATI
jgi:hypothetical protein